MRIDYAAIAAAVQPGEDYEQAYTRMSAETETVTLNEARITEGDVLRGLGVTAGATALGVFEAQLPASVNRLIQSEGIDMAHAESRATVESMRGLLGDAAADWLLAQNQKVQSKWPGLKPGHIQNAIEWGA